MKPNALREQLTALGADALAEFLIGESLNNPALRKQLDLLVVRRDPSKLAKKLRREISNLKRAQRFIDWREAGAFVQNLEGLTLRIETDLLPQEPKCSADLIESLIDADAQLFERIDDSNGELGDFFQGLIVLWGKAWAAIEPRDTVTLVETLLDHLKNNDYGAKDGLILAFKKVLGEAGLNLLEKRVLKDKEQFGAYGVRGILESIADALGDVDRYIAHIKEEGTINTHIVAEIAARLLAKWRSAEAIEWLLHQPNDIGLSATQCNLEKVTGSDLKRFDLLLEAYDAETLLEDAHALRWRLFELTMGVDYYRGLLKHQSPDKVQEIQSQALRFALSEYTGSALVVLQFLISIQALDAAAKLVAQRFGELDGRTYYSVRPMAKTLGDAGHVLAACLLRRKLVDSILEIAQSKYYRYAVSDFTIAARHADAVRDWRGFPNHAQYVLSLKTNHGRKSAFWSQLESAA